MIPLLLIVNIKDPKRQSFRLWIPLIVVWLLILPLVLLLLPLLFMALLIVGVNPFRAIGALWQILAGLRGTNVEVADRNSLVLVHIY